MRAQFRDTFTAAAQQPALRPLPTLSDPGYMFHGPTDPAKAHNLDEKEETESILALQRPSVAEASSHKMPEWEPKSEDFFAGSDGEEGDPEAGSSDDEEEEDQIEIGEL